ncbi:unnamed protein product, partial [Effrenium voratum]
VAHSFKNHRTQQSESEACTKGEFAAFRAFSCIAMSVRATSQCSWGRPMMHLSDGTGRDWYILGDAKSKNGHWTPPKKSLSRSSTDEEPRKAPTGARRISPEKRLSSLSLSRNVQPKPPKAVIERWRQQADEANAKSQTPSMDVDPAVKMPEAPVHAYSYFSDTRMLRRLAYCSSGPRLTTLPESGAGDSEFQQNEV